MIFRTEVISSRSASVGNCNEHAARRRRRVDWRRDVDVYTGGNHRHRHEYVMAGVDEDKRYILNYGTAMAITVFFMTLSLLHICAC